MLEFPPVEESSTVRAGSVTVLWYIRHALVIVIVIRASGSAVRVSTSTKMHTGRDAVNGLIGETDQGCQRVIS